MNENTSLILKSFSSVVGEAFVSKQTYNNPPLPDDVIKKLARKLNDEIDIPYIPEFIEQLGFEKSLKVIDGIIAKKLNPEYHMHYLDIVTAYADGGAQEVAKDIVRVVNIYLDIPMLSEQDEKEILTAIADIILSFLPK